MVMVLSGDGTITGLVAGGLPTASILYEDLQQVSAGKVLGRNTSGAGVVQELPIAVDAGGSVGLGRNPMRKLDLASTGSCEQVISQTDAKVDGKNWNFLVDGGNSSTNANFTLRLLNDAGNAAPLTGFVINGTTGQRYTPIGFSSTTYAAYDCRAWINFLGTGTISIRASGNVSSITRLGTGRYQINLATAMPDSNYCYTFGGKPSADTIAGYKTDFNQTNTSGIVYMQTGSSTATADFTDVCFALFR